jgi:hypothetical protein
MWKAGHPERRKGGASDGLRERRRHQEDAWLARNVDRRWQQLRDQYHDARAVTVSPDGLPSPSVQLD